MPSVRVESNFDSFRIYINDLPHLRIKREEYLGFQSWMMGDRKWCINHYLVRGEGSIDILCEYDNRQLWEDILKELDKINFNS